MKKIHHRLMNSSQFYKRWHENSIYSVLHWAVFTSVAIFIAFSLSGIIARYSTLNLAQVSAPGATSGVAPFVRFEPDQYNSTSALLNATARWDTGSITNTNPFVGAEDINTASNHVTLESGGGYGGRTKFMRYNFPADPNQGEVTIGRMIGFNNLDSSNDVWIEASVRLGSNFEVAFSGNTNLAPVSAYKFLFLTFPSTGRFQQTLVYNSSTAVLGDANIQDRGLFGYPNIMDGQWHVVRWHAKRHPTNGVNEIEIDGRSVYSFQGDTGQADGTRWYGLAIGRNSNRGWSQNTTLDVGHVAVYTSNPNWSGGATVPTPQAPAPVTTPTPTVTLVASPTSITPPQSSTISWSSTNATSCTASGGWSGTKATSGSQSVAPTSNTTYALSCNGSGGTGSQVVTVISTPQAVVQPASNAWLSEDFSTVSNISQLQSKPWYMSSDYTRFGTVSGISIDTTDGYGGSSNSLRYNFNTGDGGIGINMKTPSNTVEYWTEIWAKVSSTFQSGGQCNGNNPDYKFVFWALQPGDGRNEIKIGNYGDMRNLDTRYNFGPDTLRIQTPNVMNDGQWHRYRAHNKVGVNGAFDVEFWDGVNQPIVLKQPNIPLGNYSFMDYVVLGANRNCNASVPMWIKWGKVTLFNQDPGWFSGSATVIPTPTVTIPTPTVTLAASPTSITSPQSSTLSWSSTDATSCTASGGWSGTKATSGSQSVAPTSNTTYTLSCSGAGGSGSQSVMVSVTAAPVPTPVSTKFSIRDQVQTISNLNVRQSPSTSATSPGTQSLGSVGTVIGGPIYANNLQWWNINYATGVDGWSAEDYLQKYVAPAPTPTVTLPSTPGTPQFSVSTSGTTNSSVQVTWPTSLNATSYRYSSGLNSAGTWNGQSGTVSSSSVALSAVPNGTTIWFCVWAVNTAGESADYSCNSYTVPTPVTAVIPTPTPISIPTPVIEQVAVTYPPAPGTPQLSVLNGRTTDSDLRVAWAESQGATSYNYTSGSNMGSSWKGQSGSIVGTYVTLSSVPNGASVWFCVLAKNSAGGSASYSCNAYIVPTQNVAVTSTPESVYVPDPSLEPTQAPNTASVTATPSIFSVGDWVAVNADKLNVRSSAGGTYSYGIQFRGTAGKIISGPTSAGNYTWWKVDFYSGIDGWVAENYLEKSSAPIPIIIGSTVYTTNRVNVRNSSSITALRLGVQKLGAKGVVLSGPVSSNGYTWWQVDFDSSPDGWVVGKYLK